ncbi:DUF2812 domain-containing protein [Metabacillus malikii]|uniref:DUF2812 domain-containing protein n=1 Tax=Metabacillus malikii TaxID=1504265 RepID=A0ABT9ZFY4_9BACI|nr:DUF2812 domain-containing protein [Metabacillus malikii]MDQ0230165.1 hypothetical protein [Metabacillus malikii]
MTRTVLKLRPRDYWRIGEHESWFSDMAANGLHLKKMGIHFAKFAKAEPKKMRYRIDVSINKKMSQDQIQLYAENGWHYVTSFNNFHVFSSPEELDAPELHTDPAEQSYTLQDFDRKLVKNAVTVAVSTIILVGLLLSTWFLFKTPILLLVKWDIVQQTILAIFCVYLAYNSIQASSSIRVLRQNLLEGKPINHRAPWKKYYKIRNLIAFGFIALVGLSAAIPFAQLYKMETNNLPETNNALPIVRLADIEDDSNLIQDKSSYSHDNIDWENSYSYYWSPLAPIQYDTYEQGLISDKQWHDKSGDYTPSIQTQVYQLSIPSLSDKLIEDLTKKYHHFNHEPLIEKTHPDLDQLIVQEEVDMKQIFASKGNRVMYVQYYGYAEIDAIVDNVVEKISVKIED